MTQFKEKILCITPTPGKQGVSIDKWKYDLIRDVILQILPSNKQGIEFKSLPKLVFKKLSISDRKRLGSIPWYTTTVKLDLETKGEIERIPLCSPQKLRIKNGL